MITFCFMNVLLRNPAIFAFKYLGSAPKQQIDVQAQNTGTFRKTSAE